MRHVLHIRRRLLSQFHEYLFFAFTLYASMMHSVLLLWAWLLPVLGVRPALEIAHELNADHASSCGGIICSKATDMTRINQGRFVINAHDTKKVAWKLKYGSAYAIHGSAECLGEDRLADAQVSSGTKNTPLITGMNDNSKCGHDHCSSEC